MQLRYIIFFPLCWLLLNKALKEIQSKEKKLKSKWKKSYMKNYIWGRGGSQRLLKVIMCFRSINCIINHHSRAEPSEPAKTEQSEVSMVVYLWPGQLIGERQCLWREAGGIWNCPVFIRGILHKERHQSGQSVTCKALPSFLGTVRYTRNSPRVYEGLHL